MSPLTKLFSPIKIGKKEIKNRIAIVSITITPTLNVPI